MENFATIMSNCLDKITENQQNEMSHLNDLLIKNSRITRKLQQAISSAISKSFNDSTTNTESIAIIKTALGLDLTPKLNQIKSDNDEAEAKAFVKIQQYQMTYADFSHVDLEDIISGLQAEKKVALEQLYSILNLDQDFKKYLNGREIKYFNASKTEYRDVFHITSLYSDELFSKCLGKFGLFSRFINRIDSETYSRMKTASLMIDNINPLAKDYIIKNKGKLTPSTITETVNDLRNEIFRCEKLEGLQKIKLSKYKYDTRIYEIAKNHKPISEEDIKSQIHACLENDSIKGDIRKLQKFLENHFMTDDSVKYLAREISELYSTRCLLLNLIAYHTRSVSILENMHDKKRVVLNKASTVVTESDVKKFSGSILSPNQINSVAILNEAMRNKVRKIKHDFSQIKIENPFDIEEHLNKLNAEPTVSSLFPLGFGFAVKKSPATNFSNSGMYDALFKTHYELLFEIEKEASLINKMESERATFTHQHIVAYAASDTPLEQV